MRVLPNDGTHRQGEEMAFEIDDISDRQRGKVFRSDAEAGPRHQAGVRRMPLAMADRTWELSVYPTAAYQPEHRPWIAWATGVVGLLLAALFQILLSAVLFFSLPLWQSRTAGTDTETASTQALSLGQVFRLPGAREVMLCFFCYCALKTTAGL